MIVCKRVIRNHAKIQKRTLSLRVLMVKRIHPREDMELEWEGVELV